MQNSKVAIVTGSNCGLGLATATTLWKDHNCHVVIACRDEKKAREAIKTICGSEAHERLEFIQLDLSSLESVNKFAENFNAKHKHLDVLINNAGMFSSKLENTGDGFEKMFQVNYLGHFLLTNRLLGALKSSPSTARIINIGSNAYKFAHPTAVDEIPLKVDKEKSLWTLTSLKLYGSSKLCNLWFSIALRKKLEEQGVNNITIATMHPGAVKTELGREGAAFMKPIMNVIYKLFFISATEAAKPTVKVAMAAPTDLTTGQYWDTNKVVPITKLADSLSSALKLWDKSVEMLASKGYTL